MRLDVLGLALCSLVATSLQAVQLEPSMVELEWEPSPSPGIARVN